MRVVTPAMKLDVRIDEAKADQGLLKLSGLAGILPCEVTLTPVELRRLLLRVLRPSTLALLLSRKRP